MRHHKETPHRKIEGIALGILPDSTKRWLKRFFVTTTWSFGCIAIFETTDVN